MQGNILKTIRKNKGLSQQDIGDIIGVKKAYISLIEVGKNKLSVKQIEAIEKALNVKFSDYEQEKTTDAKSQFQKELNLTESEFQELVKFIEEDKYTLFLFIKARNGDKTALDTLKKLLSI
jgi:transcriptional regulator with XRE-family HTH domain